MDELGTLRKLDPRKLWPSEPADFTPWLAEHIEVMGAILGMELELVEVESSVGGFSADILARDLGRDQSVVIENQLEPTDHSHLGQLITYAAGLEAGTVVWVSRAFREEHRQALDWLNRGHGTSTNFFGVVVEVLQIDDSRPAPSFRVVAAPNDWSRQSRARQSSSQPSPKGLAYKQWFQALLDELREKHKFTNARVGQPQSWYAFTSGFKGMLYGICFAAKGRVRAELYIDTGDGDRNQEVFQLLRSHNDELQTDFEETLEWEELEGKRACRVAVYRSGTILDSEVDLAKHRAWTISRILKVKKVFGPHIKQLSSLS